jgi:hypothetical protein
MIKASVGLLVSLIGIVAGVAIGTRADPNLVNGGGAALLAGCGVFSGWKCAEYLHSHIKQSSKNRRVRPEERTVGIFFGAVYIGLLAWLADALKEGRIGLAFIAVVCGVAVFFIHVYLKAETNKHTGEH